MRTDRRGANAIEFAMLMPLYVAFMLGIIDYSWMTYQTSSVTASTQEGCRSASMMDPGVGEAQMSVVRAAANARMKAKVLEKGLPCATGCTQVTSAVGVYPNRSLRCDLRVPFNSLTGLSPAPANLRSRAVVRLEYQRR
jgi:Flp pilus assembly protein TadG